MAITDANVVEEEVAPPSAPEPEPAGTELAVVEERVDLAVIEHPEARMLRQAETLAKSNIVPKQYMGRPGDIVAAGLMGQSYGLDLMQALRSIHVVEGKPTMAAEAMLAMVRKHGHSVQGKKGRTAVTITGVRSDNGDTLEVEWTLEDAKDAGLLNKNNWKKYPRQMLWARAVSELCTSLFSDVTNGLYVYDELQDAELEVLETRPDHILNVETGELEPITQPKPNQALVDEVLARFDELPTDVQVSCEEWVGKFTAADGSPAGMAMTRESIEEWHVDSIATVIEALKAKAQRVVHAENGIESTVARDTRLSGALDAMDEEKRGLFDAWCQEENIPPWGSAMEESNIFKIDAWVRADAGEEPFAEVEADD